MYCGLWAVRPRPYVTYVYIYSLYLRDTYKICTQYMLYDTIRTKNCQENVFERILFVAKNEKQGFLQCPANDVLKKHV